MTRNVYLFEPALDPAEKPLAQIMREAEIARAKETVRIVRAFRDAIADFFDRITSSDDEVAVRKKAAPRPANDTDTRLAA